ncbi:MAG TPA: response regulator [Patescibacteria group bacterium]|nr:response regulator [Patescibacteria group bacterium]
MQTILIVEDDTQTQGLYKEALTQAGFETTVAGNIAQARTMVNEKPPDLVLLDIMMPGGENGFDFLETLQKDPHFKTIPVIVLTNLDSEEKTAKEIGAKEYLIKTNVSINEIIAAVKRHLAS